MKPRRKIFFGGALLVLTVAAIAQFQFQRGGGRRFLGGDSGPAIRTEGGISVDEDSVRTARETARHSTETPNWTNEPAFDKDVFTFARVIYKFDKMRSPAWMAWINDYPDSDLNLSFRLQQLTSIKSNPDGRVLKFTDPALFDYPWIYVVKAGRMELRDEDVPLLRKYLLNGGVLMADDFWGDADWRNFEREIKRALPDYQWTELPVTHPIFHCVFDLKGPKNKLQVPSIH